MAERQTFWIDGYEDLTIDWSKSPNGHYYSNKAPGPMLLAYPVFQLMYSLNTANIADETGRKSFCKDGKIIDQWLPFLSFLTQQFFAILLALWSIQFLLNLQVSLTAIFFGVIGILMGTIPSFFFNTFFGHGLAALFIFGALLAALTGRIAISAFFIGWGILSDYGAALLLPGMLYIWSRHSPKPIYKNLAPIFVGAAIPGVLWIWYHVSAFGSPWNIAQKFQNPDFVHSDDPQVGLWGVLYNFPNPQILFELTLGFSRGLLWTQPLALVLPFMTCLKMADPPEGSRQKILYSTAIFSLLGLLLLLCMNASFTGWDGGLTLAARYLSPILLCFALWSALSYDHLNPQGKLILWIALSVSVIYFGLALSITPLAPNDPLWIYYWNELNSPERYWRFGSYLLGLGGIMFWYSSFQHRKDSQSFLK